MEIIFQPWAIAFIVALVSVLGGFHLHRFNAFKTASAIFRSAVLAELGTVYPIPAPWPDNIDTFLRSRFSAMQTAVENFGPSVPWWRKRGFNRAWRSFYNANPSGYDHQCYDHYTEILSSERPIQNVRAIFQANVKRLLSYAKET